ncbi:MAG: squalene synthase HpnC [Betaproteobacteria bacterium]|nr:squalene synthase HpnC [Betaproteobacteria bacterium]
MPVDHYENFPVASLLLPRHLHEPVTAIYAFARSADDIADEGDLPPEARLTQLDGYRGELDRIAAGHGAATPLFRRLARTIAAHGLPLQPFRDLLDAFSQDVVKHRYADFAELRDYCRRSADPVGRLLLHLYDASSDEHQRQSDAICTSLQLINFLQDVAGDWARGRVYLPQSELREHGVGEAQIGAGQCDEHWRRLMAAQIERARSLMLSGAPLGRALPGRIGLELRMIVAGGLRILDKLAVCRGDVFRARSVLRAADWPLLLWRAIRG